MSAPLLVVDSGPLIALARLQRLGLPSQLFKDVVVPATVWAEVTRSHRHPHESVALNAALASSFLRVVADVSDLLDLTALGAGERSVISMAVMLRATVLIDERRGRAVAAGFGLQVVGTLGLLVRARQLGLLDRLRPLTDELLTGGYFLADALVAQALAAVGE